MAVSKKDDNGYATWSGISCVDGITPTRIKLNAATGGMLIDTTTVISVTPSSTFQHMDDNDFPVIKGVSSADATVILPLYVNPTTGAVLADVT